ncbi:hypothetical protein M0R04_07360 [Candidatus Dojkabacteria bacterium]|jgi:hypothetical protein|nr:hypothetical protein [Candidatus Dojkabacteria bacterium]
MCEKSEKLELKIVELEQRLSRLEYVVFPQPKEQSGPGQRQIPSNPNRTESGMGPLLNSNSDFI